MAKTAFKVIGGLIIFIFLLLAVGILVISRINPNEYIPQIKEQVRSQLGAELELKSIGWKFWPNFALDLQGIKLSSQAKSHQELLAVDNASVEVAVLPLLSKNVQIDHVSLKEPQIWFHQYADGTHNWQPLLDKLQTSDKEKQPQTETQPSEKLNIAVDHVGISGGKVNVSGETQATLSKLNLDVRDIQFTDPIPVMLSAHVKVTAPDPQEFDTSFNSNVQINEDFSLIQLHKMSISVKGQKQDQTLALNGNANINTVNSAIKTDLTLEPVNLDAWMTLIPPSKPDPATGANTKAKATKAEPVELPKELIKGLNLEANLNLKDVKINGASHHFEMKGKVQKGYATMHDVKFEAYQGVAKGNLELNVNPSPAKLKVDLDVSNMNIAEILQTWMQVQPINGTIKSDINVETTGDTVDQLIKGLKGTSGITMENAILPRVNFNDLLWNNLQSRSGDLVALLDQFPQVKKELGTLKTPKILRGTTELEKLLAQVQISPQTVQSQKITASLEGQPIEGQFIYGRLTEKLTLKTALKLPFEKQELADIVWPLSCTGSLAGSFGCTVDTAALQPVLKQLAKDEVKSRLKEEFAPHEQKARDELKKAENKAKAKVEEKLGTSLKNLFGN